MAADSIETTIATTTLGEIVTRGRLLDTSGNKLAGFVQTYRLWRGSRVLHLQIELDPVEEPRADPWNSYYCCRFAWSDELLEMFRTVNETAPACQREALRAPHYIELSDEKFSTTILTGGLPFHRRHEERMLDTLLVTRGERQRKFRLGIGIDLAHPLHEAIGLLTPPVVLHDVAAPRRRQRLALAPQLAQCDRHQPVACGGERPRDGLSPPPAGNRGPAGQSGNHGVQGNSIGHDG